MKDAHAGGSGTIAWALPDGWPLAVLVGLSAAYVIGSAALGIRHLRSR